MNFPLILGPTAVGKTEVAVSLAKEVEGEIISCDSRAVYKGLDIGTAKPSPRVKGHITHHLIDIKEPNENYDVMDFREDVKDAIEEILERDRLPILVGGSTLYVKAITAEFFEGPSADQKLREQLKKEDLQDLYKKLKRVDPRASERIHPNDEQRIIRALEVYEKTGKPISTLQDEEGKELPHDFLKIGLKMKRDKLYQRINHRVDAMIDRGLVEEARNLKPKLDHDSQAYKTIGYQEIFEYLDGEKSLEEAVQEIKINTRHLAKRQMTWFRRDEQIHWIDASDKMVEEITERIKSLPNFPPL